MKKTVEVEELVPAETVSDSEKIKFYLDKYKSAEDAEERKKTSRGKGTFFDVILSSGLDAVIRKTTNTKEQFLVLMPSQDTYCYKEDSKVLDFLDAGSDGLASFLKGAPAEGISVANIVFDKICLVDASSLYDMVHTYREELKNGMMSLSLSRKSALVNLLSSDRKLWKMLTTKTPILSNQDKYNENFIRLTQLFNKYRGYDVARSFADSYVRSSLNHVCLPRQGYYYRYYGSYDISSSAENIISSVSEFNSKRLIEYLCFDMYAQGFDYIDINTYGDYIDMAETYEGKVKDKYPKYLVTAHDVMSVKAASLKKIIDEKHFLERYKSFKDEYMLDDGPVFKYDGKEFILPTASSDLIEEGMALGHCVGTYVSRVADGECLIGFVRHTDDPDKSYLTVELKEVNDYGTKNYCICQIQGDHVRRTLTEDEVRFFKKFMDKTGFISTNGNLS